MVTILLLALFVSVFFGKIYVYFNKKHEIYKWEIELIKLCEENETLSKTSFNFTPYYRSVQETRDFEYKENLWKQVAQVYLNKIVNSPFNKLCGFNVHSTSKSFIAISIRYKHDNNEILLFENIKVDIPNDIKEHLLVMEFINTFANMSNEEVLTKVLSYLNDYRK